MRIEYLCDHASLAPQLAAAHHEAFAALLPHWTYDEALTELQSHRSRRAIPTTLVALDPEARWLGSASLLANDDERIRAYSPWLASLYVRPEARGRGCAGALVLRVLQEARALGVELLYLYCQPTLVDFYTRQGWAVCDRLTLSGAPVVVMVRSTAAQDA